MKCNSNKFIKYLPTGTSSSSLNSAVSLTLATESCEWLKDSLDGSLMLSVERPVSSRTATYIHHILKHVINDYGCRAKVTYKKNTRQNFYHASYALRSICYGHVSACLSQVKVLLKRLNVGWRKQCHQHDIPGTLVFLSQKSFRMGSPPTRTPNAGGVGQS